MTLKDEWIKEKSEKTVLSFSLPRAKKRKDTENTECQKVNTSQKKLEPVSVVE